MYDSHVALEKPTDTPHAQRILPKHPFGIPGSPRRSRLPQPTDEAIPPLVVSLVAVAQITGQCCAAVHRFVGETTGNPGRIARLPRSHMRNRAFRGLATIFPRSTAVWLEYARLCLENPFCGARQCSDRDFGFH
jgi:hypothetical protein